MGLAAAQPDTLLGVAMNDVGPEIDAQGIEVIMGYLGRNPAAKTHEDAAAALRHVMRGFSDVPDERWMQEAKTHFVPADDGLKITYDPALRNAVEAAGHQATPDLWPYFDALPNKPLALIWGENSDLLKEPTVQEMQRRRPNMIVARVPGRGHVPFLDEPESLDALHRWIEALR
jgi:pimeloyl-ACP methyl ester carboxylesterase